VIQVVDDRKADNWPNAEPVVVADALRATLRESDTLTHLQDGRFGVVLEDTAESGAISTMERLRLHLEENHPSLTLWIGAACYPTHALTAGELIDRADTALAAARDWHQSRIEVAVDE
jgi:diguanylate cyclase (GGDEF)-like protein